MLPTFNDGVTAIKTGLLAWGMDFYDLAQIQLSLLSD
jgi:hypothetical protein